MKTIRINIWMLIAIFGITLNVVMVFIKSDFGVDEPARTPTTIEKLVISSNDKLADLQAGNWSHTNKDGCDFQCRVNKSGLSNLNENLYKGECDIRTAVAMWENSPKHKEVLDSSFNTFAILGVKMDNGECYFVLQHTNDH